VANAINAVAGGGSLISFPVIVALRVPELQANATNAVGLWPGSLGAMLGFANLIKKTQHHLKALFLPTLIGSYLGARLLVETSPRTFQLVVPGLILVAALILLLQPRIKAIVLRENRVLHPAAGMLAQFVVAIYGGYFGAGMGIMMLAAFALYMEGTIHELNAVKVWLGLVINLVASIEFIRQGLIVFAPAMALVVGGIIGGFLAARFSQKVDSEKMRLAIAAYGLLMAGFFAWRAFAAG
jgi:uncharacterized protein